MEIQSEESRIIRGNAVGGSNIYVLLAPSLETTDWIVVAVLTSWAETKQMLKKYPEVIYDAIILDSEQGLRERYLL